MTPEVCTNMLELYFKFYNKKQVQLSFLEFFCDFSAYNESQDYVRIFLDNKKFERSLINLIFGEFTQSIFKKNSLLILHNFYTISPKYKTIWIEDEFLLEKLINSFY